MPSWKREPYVDATGAWRGPKDDYIITLMNQVRGVDGMMNTKMKLLVGEGREDNI